MSQEEKKVPYLKKLCTGDTVWKVFEPSTLRFSSMDHNFRLLPLKQQHQQQWLKHQMNEYNFRPHCFCGLMFVLFLFLFCIDIFFLFTISIMNIEIASGSGGKRGFTAKAGDTTR
jgi:hypothetical protein